MTRPLGLTVVLACLSIAGAHAAPVNHAHHHYHMGTRAYAGERHAAMLYQEAQREGLELLLAKDNAAQMRRLALELGEWVKRLEAAQTPAEARLIGADLLALSRAAGEARRRAAELESWLDSALAARKPGSAAKASAELRARVTLRSRQLFGDFAAALGAHKRAEERLGIVSPADPPSAEAPR